MENFISSKEFGGDVKTALRRWAKKSVVLGGFLLSLFLDGGCHDIKFPESYKAEAVETDAGGEADGADGDNEDRGKSCKTMHDCPSSEDACEVVSCTYRAGDSVGALSPN